MSSIICGVVIRGRQLGRRLGFPTANLSPGATPVTSDGVWAARVRLDSPDGAAFDAVANLGVRPSVEGAAQRLLEVHIFGFEGDLYGRTIEVELVRRLRPERCFASREELHAQIERDAKQAQQILNESKTPLI
ncbi:hypothetical protein FACS1894159_11260 [Bacteroidia bacterium]|nr:hypothetical protein FACS1894159_11260 [Bacteroidia bacterium]